MEEEKKYQENPIQEKKEFLKREEIDTMEKDVARLREMEAQKEKERIASLNVDGLSKTQESEKETSKKEAESGLLIPKSIKKPPSYQKLIVRLGLIFLIILIGGLIYWNYSNKPTEPKEENNLPASEEPASPDDSAIETPTQPEIPLPLIPTSSSQILEIGSVDQIPATLAAFLKETPEEGFIQILFKNNSENKFLNLAEFSSGFNIKYPEGFLEGLEGNPTFFSYFSQGAHRFGFVIKTKDQGTTGKLLKEWEAAIEEDADLLFQTLGKQGKSLVPYFRQVNYKNTSFRFLTISKNDFGICYSLTNNYLIFTTSFESIQKVINQIITQ